MQETTLTQVLIERLRSGEVEKLTRSRKSKKIEFRREVGNNSFRADIFISFTDEDQEINAQNILNSRVTNFIAIEVKIKDWRQGLYQAWRYQSFAEKSYLALYEPYAKSVNIKLFEEHNVGLIVFNEHKVEVRHQPRKNAFKRSDTYSYILREQIWQSLPTMESI